MPQDSYSLDEHEQEAAAIDDGDDENIAGGKSTEEVWDQVPRIE